MGQVDDPVRLVLTLELTATAEPITGIACAGDQSGQAFSGWSELFAVLHALVTQAGGASDGPDHHASRHAERQGPWRPA